MDKKERIMTSLQQRYKEVEEMGYEIVGIFLQGSQNYELDYEGSDIDTKAIILPKFRDFVLNKQPVSTTHICENNEHIDLKDIRLMFECFKKQNINFVEVLFTQYKILNPKYEEYFKKLLDNNEMIARYNNYASLSCIVGTASEKYKALEHPYPSLIEKIKKYGYDGKQLHHLLRLREFLPRYCNGEPYKDCLISRSRDFLIKVKKNEAYSLEEARIIAKSTLDAMMEYRQKYMETTPVLKNDLVELLLNEVLLEIMESNFKFELGVKAYEKTNL